MEEMILDAVQANFALYIHKRNDWGDQLLGHDVL